MTMTRTRNRISLVPMALLAAGIASCQGDSTGSSPRLISAGLQASRHAADAQSMPRFTSWSEPVNLGPVVNSPATDISPRLSPDGLSLYFTSNRPGGMGGNDIWVSRRASRHGPWKPPMNVSMLNTAWEDGQASLSSDGLMLFFNSGRPGGLGAADLYVSRRSDPSDDLGWGPPVNLGPLVNTAGGDRGPQFVLRGENGAPTLYFNRGNIALQGADLYAAPMTADGLPAGPAVLIANVNVPDANDAGQFVVDDGREIWFWSERAGGFGDADLWVSSRRNVEDTWSPPVNLGAPPNTEYAEERPYVTKNGRFLFFDSFRPGGMNGSQDIWMSTRSPISDVDDDDDDVPRFSAWSAPVNLGPPVNTPFIDQAPSISKDGLSLYFHCTGCPTNIGGADIYVAQRAHVDDPWGPPQNLGPTINTTANEQAPRLSRDGHRLFFDSDRSGGAGGRDLYVSRRREQHDDFGWEPAVNLGAINSLDDDVNADPFEDAATGTSVLYYAKGPAGTGGVDIYVSTLLPDETYGPGVPVAELNTASTERQPSIRRDGLEIFLASDRQGTLGAMDLWVATRARTTDPWSTPVNLGSVVNTTNVDARPAISFDGTTLYFQSTRPGNVGCSSPTGPCVFDIWVTTRSKLTGLD